MESLPPGPKSRPVIGFIPEMRKDPLSFLTKVSQDYPGIAYFRIGPQPVYFVSDADFVKRILLDNFANYEKRWGYDKFYPIFGEGLLTSNGEFWKRQRKLTQPAFHAERLRWFSDAMVARTARMLQEWESYEPNATPFELGRDIRAVTMDIVTKTMFGIDSSTATKDVMWAINFLLAETYDRVFSALGPVKGMLPTKANREFKRAEKIMSDLILSIIRERRELGKDTGDLLSMYMQSKDDETGERMSDKQLKDEIMTLFFAGHETSAHTLSWICYALSKNPEIAKKVDEELARVLGGRPPTFDDLAKLEYMKMVIEETMRLLPASWIMTRTAVREDKLGDYTIPANAVIVISEWVMHRVAKYWPNPEGFDPERFRPGRADPRPKCSYLAFGQGPRYCIGAGFAMMEMQIMLAMMLQKYRIDLVPGHSVVPEPVMTLRPKYGVMVTIAKKSG